MRREGRGVVCLKTKALAKRSFGICWFSGSSGYVSQLVINRKGTLCCVAASLTYRRRAEEAPDTHTFPQRFCKTILITLLYSTPFSPHLVSILSCCFFLVLHPISYPLSSPDISSLPYSVDNNSRPIDAELNLVALTPAAFGSPTLAPSFNTFRISLLLLAPPAHP